MSKLLADLDSVLLEGHIAQALALEHDEQNQSFCNFTLSVVRYFKQKGEVIEKIALVPVIAFDKIAEFCVTYFHQDSRIRVVGTLESNAQQLFVMANHIEHLPSRRTSV